MGSYMTHFVNMMPIFVLVIISAAPSVWALEEDGYRNRASNYQGEDYRDVAPPASYRDDLREDAWSPPPRREGGPAWGSGASEAVGRDRFNDQGNNPADQGGYRPNPVADSRGALPAETNDRFGSPKSEVSFRLVDPDDYSLPLTREDRRPRRSKTR